MDFKNEQLNFIQSQIMSEIFKILLRHAGGSYEDIKCKSEYIILYNNLNMHVNLSLKEVENLWMD